MGTSAGAVAEVVATELPLVPMLRRGNWEIRDTPRFQDCVGTSAGAVAEVVATELPLVPMLRRGNWEISEREA